MNSRFACALLALSALLTTTPSTLALDAASDLNWCGDSTTCLAWSASAEAVHYNLYRGAGFQLPAIPLGTPDACTLGTYATTSTGPFTDAQPGPLELQWYLVGAVDELGQENAGFATGGARAVDSSGACSA